MKVYHIDMNPQICEALESTKSRVWGEPSWEESRLRSTDAQALMTLLFRITYLGFPWVQEGRGVGPLTWTSSPGSGCVPLPAWVPSLQLIVPKIKVTNAQAALLLPVLNQIYEREEWFWCFSLVQGSSSDPSQSRGAPYSFGRVL